MSIRALSPYLSAEGARVEDDDRETFGGGIDRGREAGGSGADNRDVSLIPFVDRHHSERACHFGLARILQDRALRTNCQRQVSGVWGILLDKLPCAIILFRVEQLMRIRIAGQEALQGSRPD